MGGKKILLVCGASKVFGVERITLRIIEELKQRGWSFHCILSGWNDGVFIKELERIGVPYSTVKLGWLYLKKWKWTLDTLWHYPGSIRTFKSARRQFNPDAIYFVSFQSIVMLYPFLKGKVFYHVHDQLSVSGQGRKLLSLIDKKIRNYIACSAFIRQDLVNSGISVDKVEVIYNFLSNVDIPAPAEKKEPTGLFHIGIIGQVSEHKGHHILIAALEMLQEKNYDFKLKIIGSGADAYINQIKEQIEAAGLQHKIDWLGYLPTEKEIYADLDLVIVPTVRPEPFGLVAIEPSRYNIPVIASRNGGLQEVIIDQETGLLFESGNSQDLAQKIELTINNPALLNQMGINAGKRLKACFSAPANVTLIEKTILN